MREIGLALEGEHRQPRTEIIKLKFKNAHKWKPHHWNPAEAKDPSCVGKKICVPSA